jgi:hypothetical protein
MRRVWQLAMSALAVQGAALALAWPAAAAQERGYEGVAVPGGPGDASNDAVGFLPFTGSDIGILLIAGFFLAALGVGLAHRPKARGLDAGGTSDGQG